MHLVISDLRRRPSLFNRTSSNAFDQPISRAPPPKCSGSNLLCSCGRASLSVGDWTAPDSRFSRDLCRLNQFSGWLNSTVKRAQPRTSGVVSRLAYQYCSRTRTPSTLSESARLIQHPRLIHHMLDATNFPRTNRTLSPNLRWSKHSTCQCHRTAPLRSMQRLLCLRETFGVATTFSATSHAAQHIRLLTMDMVSEVPLLRGSSQVI